MFTKFIAVSGSDDLVHQVFTIDEWLKLHRAHTFVLFNTQIDVNFIAGTMMNAFCSPLTTLPKAERHVYRNTPRCAHDLVVVGAGALGLRAARLWRASRPDATILCATWTEKRHEEIAEAGFDVTLASELDEGEHVLFCAPPSKAGPIYAQCVADAAKLASRRFLFTSSTAVYKDVPEVKEDSELSDSSRAKRLLEAEAAALAAANGRVIRLGGLYDGGRGPHAAWLRGGTCSGGEEGMLNMIHYDDAAAAVVAALNASEDKGKVFLAVDGNPLTRKELVTIALKHPRFDHFLENSWGSGGHVKRIDSSWTYQQLEWMPCWSSFEHFMQAEIDSIMNNVDLEVPAMPQPQKVLN